MSHHHLSLSEREQLAILRAKGMSFREIGRQLHRSHTTLSREYGNKAKYGREYLPCKAQAKAEKVASSQRTKAPLKTKTIFLYVRQKLRDEHWSPEIIAGRLPIDLPGESIHFETIYRYIYSQKKTWHMELWKYLPRHQHRRRKQAGRKVKVAKYLRATPLVERPAEAIGRLVAGHWETDNLGGKVSDHSTISATIERKSRYTLLQKLRNKSSITKIHQVKAGVEQFPTELRKTLTIDNGPENAKHRLLKGAFKDGVYSCQPYHSWEKGSVENTFKRSRYFIPKGTSLDSVSVHQVQQIEDWLNHTPKKCLGYMTPYEIMRLELESINKQGGAFQVRI
jgi:IS30 family transposase